MKTKIKSSRPYLFVPIFLLMSAASVSALAAEGQTENQAENVTASAPIYTSNPGMTCTCYGGPGLYRYSCPPRLETCYGGPSGSYPYQCLVCPQ